MNDDVKDYRDHWECPTCGVGLCVRAGELPQTPAHVLHDGTVCGTYVLTETNLLCDEDD